MGCHLFRNTSNTCNIALLWNYSLVAFINQRRDISGNQTYQFCTYPRSNQLHSHLYRHRRSCIRPNNGRCTWRSRGRRLDCSPGRSSPLCSRTELKPNEYLCFVCVSIVLKLNCIAGYVIVISLSTLVK